MSQIESNPFPYSDTNKRYLTLSWYFKNRFGLKTAKIPLNAGFTCPNRDGFKSRGGCLFCSARGSGDTILHFDSDLKAQFDANLERVKNKWPDCQGLPYFQAFSNTYAPLERLQSIYRPFLDDPSLPGICIATRADVLEEGFVRWISTFDKEIWIELGLQSASEKTREALNIQTSNAEIEKAVRLCHTHGLKVCLHIINGLPGEDRIQMIDTAKWCNTLEADAVKFHMLQIIADAPMAAEYEKEPFDLLSFEEYVSLVCDQIEHLRPDMVVERLTSDAPSGHLMAPLWSLNKTAVANAIDTELFRRNSYQGRLFHDCPVPDDAL